MKRFALDEILREKCVNRSELCRRIGINRSLFWRIVKTGRTTITTLEKIAEVLGMEVSDFWREDRGEK